MNPFLRVIEALNQHQVRYVVVGGFAAYMHGSRRVTVDLDLIVDLTPSEARKAVEALLAAGLQARLPVNPVEFADSVKRQSWITEKQMVVFSFLDPQTPGFIVDLFVNMPMDFEGLYARKKMLSVENLQVPICGLEDLIALKRLAGRPQDLLDVETLRTIQSLQHGEGEATS